MIWKIAKKELQLLFFSPVAWFLLVVFTIQAGMLFVGRYHDYMKTNEVYGFFFIVRKSIVGPGFHVFVFLYSIINNGVSE